MNIRTLTPADLPAIRVVSRKASLHQDRTPEQWALAALKYVDYYPCHAGDTSLALELEDGSFAGYVLCAPDADAYFQTLEQEYRPQIETLSPGSYAPFLEAQSYIREFAREYPAHLHINVVPEAQNLRAGSRLMQALLKRLKEKGIPGVCLGWTAAGSRLCISTKRTDSPFFGMQATHCSWDAGQTDPSCRLTGGFSVCRPGCGCMFCIRSQEPVIVRREGPSSWKSSSAWIGPAPAGIGTCSAETENGPGTNTGSA